MTDHDRASRARPSTTKGCGHSLAAEDSGQGHRDDRRGEASQDVTSSRQEGPRQLVRPPLPWFTLYHSSAICTRGNTIGKRLTMRWETHLFGATKQGDTFPVARKDIDDNEFTGPVYSPDHRILFANLQIPGIMFAITGPGATRADVALGTRE